jgi:phage baseplate assembly protein W
MKSWMLLPFVLIAGWMMGGWLPRVELREVREDLACAQRALKARAPRRGGFTGVTQMLGIPESAAGTADTNAVSTPPPSPDQGMAPSEPEAPQVTHAATNHPARRHSMRDGIEQAMEAWEARCDIARGTFVANVALNEEEATRFDVLVASMNIRLAHTIEQFAEQVKTGKAAGEEQSVKLVRDLSSSVATTYDELQASMPPNWRQDASEEFSVTDFIDPSVAMPLVDIEGDLEGGMFGDHP